MEIWDIRDENGCKTGATVEKAYILEDGQYHLGVDVWIRNGNGEYLIQKRSPAKRRMPNMWMSTGGSALAGEEGIDAAIRETFEEIGVEVDASRLVFLFKTRFADCINEVWLLEQEVDLKRIKMQPSEVCDVKWAGKKELAAMIENGQIIDYGTKYLSAVFNVEKLGNFLTDAAE